MLVGAVQGAVLSVLLVASRDRRPARLFLALLLAFYTLPLLKSALLDLGFLGPQSGWPWPLELLYGLGPSLYLYAKSVSDPEFRPRLRDAAHFLPVLLEVGYYASPLYRHPDNVFALTPAASPAHLLWTVQQVGAFVSIVVYLGLTNHRLWAYARWVEQSYSDIHRRNLRWLHMPVLLYTAFFVLWIALRVVDVFGFGEQLAAEAYEPLLLFLSASTYWIGIRGYLHSERIPAGLGDHASSSDRIELADQAVLARHFVELRALMEHDQPYLEPDLSLPELAERLGVNPRLLSKVINSQAQRNFYDFVNRYRVEAFKRRVAQASPGTTLLDLAHGCGFGSKATFNHVFKRETGLTPSQFRKTRLIETPGAAARPGDTS